MHYTVVGRISMGRCKEGHALVAQGYLRLYDGGKHRVQQSQVPGMVSEQEMPLLGQPFLAREPLDPVGGYQIGIDDRQHPYTGGSLLGILELPFVRSRLETAAPSQGSYLLFPAFLPSWRHQGKVAHAEWNPSISSTAWCAGWNCAKAGCFATEWPNPQGQPPEP